MANQAYRLAKSRTVSCAAREAFRVMEKIDQFPEFMPNVNKLTVLENSGTRKVAEWDTSIDETPLTWVEEGIYDAENLVIRFRALEGVFERFDGSWRVIPVSPDHASGAAQASAGEQSLEAKPDQRCTIEFELVYEIGLPEIEEMIAPLLHERLAANVESMLAAIAKRTEGSVHTVS